MQGGRREERVLYRAISGTPCGQPVMVLVLDTLMSCLAREVTGRPRQTTRLSGKDRCQIRQTSPSTEPYLGDTHRPSSRKLHITLELLSSTLLIKDRGAIGSVREAGVFHHRRGLTSSAFCFRG